MTGENTVHRLTLRLPRSQFPRFTRADDPTPTKGWAIQEFSQVFRDGEPVGLFVSLQVARDGQSVLSVERVGDGPKASDLVR